MMLSDHSIKLYRRMGVLLIEPLDEEIQIQPCSVDVRLGSKFRKFKDVEGAVLDPSKKDLDKYTELVDIGDGEYVIMPGEFVLGVTIERIKLPDFISAKLEGRSSIGRMGIEVGSYAGFVEAGFDGQLTLELFNHGHYPIILRAGMRIGQVAFEIMDHPADKPYHGKYLGQKEPTSSKIYDDKK
jgi:dCTP deaminase